MSLFCLHFNYSQERKHWQSGFNLYLKESGSKRNSLQHVQNFAEIAQWVGATVDGAQKIPHNILRFCYTYAQLICCIH